MMARLPVMMRQPTDMQLMVIQLVFPPLLVALATLATRRWGAGVGGWLGGLPLISGPISLLLALQLGPAFSAQSAIGTILGIAAVAAFCLVYAYAARSHKWPACMALALVAFFGATWLLKDLELPLVVAFPIVCAVLALTILLLGNSSPQGAPPSAHRWDIPLRMLVTLLVVVAITAAASALGPQLTGLLNAFPFFTSIMVVFSHRQGGAPGAHQMLRGILIGVFGFISFFAVVSAGLEALGLVATYIIASICAVVVNALTLLLLVKRGPAPA
jgi:hypothetical protein